MSALRTLASGTLLTHEIEIKRSRFITTLARTDTPEEARDLIDAVTGNVVNPDEGGAADQIGDGGGDASHEGSFHRQVYP